MNQNLFNLENFDNKFSEKQIIELHELLMTNGCHFIKSSNSQKVFSNLSALINNLQHFKNVAYISNLKVNFSWCNLKEQLEEYSLMSKDELLISEFLLDTFYYDLLVLEKTKQTMGFCDLVLKSLKDLGLSQKSTIFVIMETT